MDEMPPITESCSSIAECDKKERYNGSVCMSVMPVNEYIHRNIIIHNID